MPIANLNKPQIDLPVWELLASFPAGNLASGVCTCTDKTGTNRYIYHLFSAAQFWRYDTWANAWQQLATPTAGTVGAGSTMCYDPSLSRVWAILANGSAVVLQYYDVATNTWTSRSAVNVTATFGADGALVHPCSSYGFASDDTLFLWGNNSTAAFKYTISTNSWAAITAATAAIGSGCEAHYVPTLGTTKIALIRGGATSTVYIYDTTGNSYSTLTLLPGTETFTTGSNSTHRWGTNQLIIQKDITQRFYYLDVSTGAITPLAAQYQLTPGGTVVGNRLDYIKETYANTVEFLYNGFPTTYWMRMGLFF